MKTLDAVAPTVPPRTAPRPRRMRAWLQPQISIGAREQRDQAVLLLAVAVVVAPHFEHLPLWSTVAIGVLWVWRAWLTQTLAPAPGRTLMAVLLAAGTAAVWLEHGTLFGRDASVNFLLVLVGLKVLEMRAHRDVLVIVFLSLFVLQTQFLFDQGMLTALIMFAAVGMLFFVLLSVNLPEGDISFSGKMRYLTRIFLLAAPLALALFFLFPRLSAPMWRVAGGQPQSGTGLSGSMSPGSISQLLRNDAVALRARFDDRVPAQRDLYWRGPVFGAFDGRTWTAVPAQQLPAVPDVHLQAGSAVDYTVTLEPTLRRELLALELAITVDSAPGAGLATRLTPTLELQTATPIVSRLRYRARSYLAYGAGPTLADASLAPWLQLPEAGNPQTRQWAERIKAEVIAAAPAERGGALDQRLVDAVLMQFRRLPFRYNINAPVLGVDPVDEFLFRTRVGYCEHYASSFVVLMRAMGVPARVITGYQGGEVNPVDGYLTVRQSDAHAWAEVWIDHHGWQRVDPTAVIAPERVEQTLRDRRARGQAGGADSEGWLTTLRLDGEALQNAWNQWFLSYSADRQRALMGWIGLHPTMENVTAVAIATITLLLAALAALSLRRHAHHEPAAELVAQLRRKLARNGIAVPATMGLQDMERHLATVLHPQSVAPMRRLLRGLAAERYARGVPTGRRRRLRELRATLRGWRPVPRRRTPPR